MASTMRIRPDVPNRVPSAMDNTCFDERVAGPNVDEAPGAVAVLEEVVTGFVLLPGVSTVIVEVGEAVVVDDVVDEISLASRTVYLEGDQKH